MRRSTIIFILLGVIELLLILGAVFMASQVMSGAWNAPDPQEALSRIFTVIGAAIPLIAIPFVILAVGLRKKGQ